MGQFPKNIKQDLENLEFTNREIIVNFSNLYIWDDEYTMNNEIDGMTVDILDIHLGIRQDRKFTVNVFLTDDDWYICYVDLYEWKGSWRKGQLDDHECYKCDSLEGLIIFIEDVCLSWSL
jgi:hypothetical protein